jgi:hypothetical protein
MNLPGQRERTIHTPFIRLPDAENMVTGTSKQYGDMFRRLSTSFSAAVDVSFSAHRHISRNPCGLRQSP